MKRKTKLKLIENYIDIHKLLYKCKINYLFAKTEETLIFLETLCSRLNKIKLEHERFFQTINMYDSSFLILKKELEQGLKQTFIPSLIPQENTLNERAILIENNFFSLKENFTKKKRHC